MAPLGSLDCCSVCLLSIQSVKSFQALKIGLTSRVVIAQIGPIFMLGLGLLHSIHGSQPPLVGFCLVHELLGFGRGLHRLNGMAAWLSWRPTRRRPWRRRRGWGGRRFPKSSPPLSDRLWLGLLLGESGRGWQSWGQSGVIGVDPGG